MPKKLQAIVLAAGKSTRFRTGRTKLLEKICGQKMILYPTKLLANMDLDITVVVGYQKNQIKQLLTDQHKDNIKFVEQEKQLGTGHAILCTQETWKEDNILIMNGDAPLVTKEIIEQLYNKHIQTNATISFITSHIIDTTNRSYGRVLTTKNSIKIIEACELDNQETSEHCCINAGIYIIKKEFLQEHATTIQRNKTSKEFFITDLVKIASDKKHTVTTLSAPFDHIRGINTFEELWAAEHLKRTELIKYWMSRGVRFSVAQNVHIDLDVTIDAGSYIGCGVHLLNGTRLGKNVKIHEFASLQDTTVGDDTHIYAFSIIENAMIGKNSKVGPFVRMRDKVKLGDHAVIGNFVEVKNSTIGTYSSAKHLTYLGDTDIGDNVNIGAGTITCNYDGVKKNRTTIKDDAFIGSNNTLVAPVTINENAYTAAGSVITQDVPAHALGIARERQTNKEGYAKKLQQKKQIKAAQREEKKTESLKNNTPAKKQPMSFMGAVKALNDLPIAEE